MRPNQAPEASAMFTNWRCTFAGDLPMYSKQGCTFLTRTNTVNASCRATDDKVGMRGPGLDSAGTSNAPQPGS